MAKGRYGDFGGQYIPETLMNEIHKLEDAYEFYKNDKQFNDELNTLLREYAGRPSLLYYAEKMTKDLGGAKIYFKRGSEPHRFAQDKQCTRSGSPCEEDGQDPHNRGDRSRSARRCGGDCGGSARAGV